MCIIAAVVATLTIGAAWEVQARTLPFHNGGVRKLSQQAQDGLAVAPTAPGVLTLVVLGDSYSDVGRRLAASNGTGPDPKWYWHGRYSNGPVWAEYLPNISATFPQAQGQPLVTVENFAFGGAPACSGHARDEKPPKPAVKEQIAQFFASLNATTANSTSGTLGLAGAGAGAGAGDTPLPDARRVVVLQFGANDYLNELENVSRHGDFNFGLPELPLNVVQCIKEGAVQLLEAGERHLVIMTLPPVDRLPMLQGGPLELIRGWTSRIAERHDTALRQAVAELRATYSAANQTSDQLGQNQTATIELYELGNVMTAFVDQKEAFGFTDAEKQCLQYGNAVGNFLSKIPLVGSALGDKVNDLGGGDIKGECDNPDQHVYWDKVHPTTRAHSLLASNFSQTVLAPALAGGV